MSWNVAIEVSVLPDDVKDRPFTDAIRIDCSHEQYQSIATPGLGIIANDPSGRVILSGTAILSPTQQVTLARVAISLAHLYG
jgi:hypothetical protein